MNRIRPFFIACCMLSLTVGSAQADFATTFSSIGLFKPNPAQTKGFLDSWVNPYSWHFATAGIAATGCLAYTGYNWWQRYQATKLKKEKRPAGTLTQIYTQQYERQLTQTLAQAITSEHAKHSRTQLSSPRSQGRILTCIEIPRLQRCFANQQTLLALSPLLSKLILNTSTLKIDPQAIALTTQDNGTIRNFLLDNQPEKAAQYALCLHVFKSVAVSVRLGSLTRFAPDNIEAEIVQALNGITQELQKLFQMYTKTQEVRMNKQNLKQQRLATQNALLKAFYSITPQTTLSKNEQAAYEEFATLWEGCYTVQIGKDLQKSAQNKY